MNKILHLVLILFIILPSCKEERVLQECDNFPIKELAGSQQDNKIIDAIIDEYYPDIDFLHIVQESGNEIIQESVFLYLDLNNVPVDSQMVFNYETVNEQTDLVGTNVKSPAILIAAEEIQCLQTFERYYEKYPDSHGYLIFNNIGYNDAGDEAIVDFGHYRASLGAMGQFVVLTKQGNSWIISHKIATWIS